ncbi:type IX secretion system membrane protein PorP/SprF [Dokdonia sinensis]|uniref:Type IX secretion system membrane protein PorP/SprF n=1 Tax=Dokdonia sinensis TaxID=2479847 RepID=A0A3M0FUA4_9FLAO|nr:type IX secretion system membrane protein PorP/SprF [Dokdonia sinensis]RMB56065.1 type IX secretion system membrane protein PorP/SprF [Dokdonia sinensis]
MLSKINQYLTIFLVLCCTINTMAQQDPQYTHYMYNTMSVNPGYAGQRNTLSITGLNRTQWVGIEGAPNTFSFAAHGPMRNERVGLGLSAVADQLGPAQEIYVDANFSYTIPVSYSRETKLSFGLKGGIHQLDTDWSKGQFQNPDVTFTENISLLSPTVGAGLYLHSNDWYFGASVPNILSTSHYDDFSESIASERLHVFLIAGMVFDLNQDLKFKPSAFAKAVQGAPVIVDVSANFLLYEKLNLGVAWRWDDALSAMAGFQVTEGLMIGYGYDYTTSGLNNYTSGSHEILIRFEVQKLGRFLSPRFF